MSRMRFNRAAAFGVAVAVLVAAALVASSLVTGASAATKSVIVQLKGDPVVVAKAAAAAQGREFDELAYRQQLVNEQNEFLNQLSASGVGFDLVGVDAPNGPNGEVAHIDFRFNYVYNGLTLAVPESAIPAIEAMSQVESVHPDAQMEVTLDHAVKYTRVPSLYGNPPQLKMGDALATGGVHGEGTIIAVIDTGIDWTHPMFGGDPTPPQFGVGPSVANSNRKVIYYMNFTAGAVSDDFGHGTHVAGIAAGYTAKAPGPDGLPLTSDDVAIHGVAPQARLMAYKSLSATGLGVQSSSIMSLEDAVQPVTLTGIPKPVPHVINMSLGNSSSHNPKDPAAVAADNATLAGVTVVASAGNSGRPTPTNPTGEHTIGSPGVGSRVITVGANIDPGSGPNSVDVVTGEYTGMKAFMLAASAPLAGDITNEYVFCGLAETADQVPDSVRGRIALIERGSTVSTPSSVGGVGLPTSAGTGLAATKVGYAAAKGAVAVILFNNADGEITNLTVYKSTIPALGMNRVNGLRLKGLIGSDAFGAVSQKRIRINKSLLFEPEMADFSSKGPVDGYGMIKPDVTAPGVAVLSATVRAGGVTPDPGYMFDPTGYVSASGTSMSSPMTAGIAALVKQKNPTWTPSMIRAALMNTATNLRRSDGTPVPDGTHTLNQQGAGLVDAYAAANAKAMMGTGQFAPPGEPSPNRTFGVFVSSSPGPDFVPSHSFGAVQIAGVVGSVTRSQTVTITDIREGAGAGAYRLSSSAVRNVPEGVSVSFTNAAGEPVSEVEVPANGSASFNVNVTVNGESVPANPTQIEWYVTAARSDGGQTLRMPFQFRAVRPTVTAAAPTMGAVSGNEVAGNPPTDVDGGYRLSYGYAGTPAPVKFRVQESNDNGATWATLADVPATQTAFDVAGRGNGNYLYRVVGLFSVEHGLIDGPASAARAVAVDRRAEADVTSLIQAAMVDGTVSFAGGVFQFDQTLRNASADAAVFVPLRFTITSVSSRSGKVKVQNADNNGDGVSGHAAFDYAAQAGADQRLTPGETSGARRLQFANPSAEMFEFTAVVRGHLPDAANASGAAASGGADGSSSSSSTSTDGGATGATSLGGTLQQAGAALRFVVNPLTRSVSVSPAR